MASSILSFQARRLALGLTQTELAARLGVARQTIVRLERQAETPRLYDLAMRGLEQLELTAPSYPNHQSQPRRRQA